MIRNGRGDRRAGCATPPNIAGRARANACEPCRRDMRPIIGLPTGPPATYGHSRTSRPTRQLIQLRPQLPRGFLVLRRWPPFLAARAFHLGTRGPVNFSRNRFPGTNPCRCPRPAAVSPRLARFRWPPTTARASGGRPGIALMLPATSVPGRTPFPFFRWRCRLSCRGFDSRRRIRRGLGHRTIDRSVPVPRHRVRRSLAIIGQGNHQLPQF